jgi:branched-subunit amino acid transport protein
MSITWLVVTMGAGVYALRLAGLVLPGRPTASASAGALHFVPVALLAALVVASLGSHPEGPGLRLLALAGAALVASRTRRMWIPIVAGLLLYGLLTLT